MNDAIRRGLRTLLQAGILGLGIEVVQAFTNDVLTAREVAAIMALGTPLISFFMNLLEDNTPFPALLKSPASVGKNPTPDTARHLEVHESE